MVKNISSVVTTHKWHGKPILYVHTVQYYGVWQYGKGEPSGKGEKKKLY